MTEITSIIKLFMEPGIKNDSPAQASIRPGALLTGRITEILPSGLLQIDFGKFRSQAKVKFPVVKGDSLRFEVLETGDPIKLQLQEPPPAAIKEPAGRLFKPEDLNQFRQALEAILRKPVDPFLDRESPGKTRLLLSRLSSHLLPLSPEKGTDQIATLLKSSLNNSGLFFEKKLETALLRIFKSPGKIDVGRAISHPFITTIFDSDLKPNLIRLAAALARTAVARDHTLVSIRELSLGLLDHIQTEQEKLTRYSPVESGKRPFTYNRADRHLFGLQKALVPNPPDGKTKEVQLLLIKSGLWSDPEIRSSAGALESFTYRGMKTDGLSLYGPGEKAANGTGTHRLKTDASQIEKTGIQKMIAGLVKSSTPMQSKALGPLLKAFQTYVRENQITLDQKTNTALDHLGKVIRAQVSRATPALPGSGRLPQNVKQSLVTLKRFIDSRLLPSSRESLPMSGRQKRAPAGSRVAESKRESLGAFTALVNRKAAFLAGKLDRLAKDLARFSANSADHPDEKKIVKTAQSIRALIRQHQLPTGEGVNRALAEIESGSLPAKTAPLSAFQTGPLTDRLIQELVLLREFVDQQKTQLNENLETLRNLLGRAETEIDTGDRPGSERGRSAEPVQVIAFSIPMEDGKKTARLKVFYPLKRRPGAHSGHRISLLLSMDRMGRIRTDIFAHDRNLDIKFSTENEPARQHIGGHLNWLGDLLNGHFKTVNLSTTVDEKTIAAFEYEDLEIPDDRKVDLQV